MKTQLLNGRLVAEEIKASVKKQAQAFYSRTEKKPGLAVILVGKDPASEIYVRQKIKSAQEVGIEPKLFTLSQQDSFKTLEQKIIRCNQDPLIHAFLVQLPLPKSWPVQQALALIDPKKDADGLTPLNQGRLINQTGFLKGATFKVSPSSTEDVKPKTSNQVHLNQTGFLKGATFKVSPSSTENVKQEFLDINSASLVGPCTPLGIMSLLRYYDIALEGKSAVVVGRSHIVGRPMAELLLKANATVTLCHSRTKELSSFTQRADIVVVSAGVLGLLGQKDFKKGAIVVDVGLHRITKGDKTKLVGDVRSEGLKDYVSWLTPVPGGVGPMTVAMLLKNTLTLALTSAVGKEADR